LYFREREAQPHFVAPNTFESEWAQRWRALEEMEVAQKEALDKQFKEAREKLESEMDQAIQEHEAVLMRQGFCVTIFCLKNLKNVKTTL